MLPNRIRAKAFFNKSVNPADFTAIFHKWIQEQVFENHLLIDIADYQHVYQGPSIVLVGYEADFIIDLAGGRAGLLYVRKRSWPEGDLAKRVHIVLASFASAAKLLGEESSLDAELGLGELELSFADRLNTPNKSESYQALEESVQKALDEFYKQGVEVKPIEQDARRALGFQVKIQGN